MNRKDFIKKIGFGVAGAPILSTSFLACKETPASRIIDPNVCVPAPTEIAGPFPIKNPADRVRENIVGNKSGIPLVVNFTVQNTNHGCRPLPGVFVDLWQCDAKGNYSEYSGQLDGSFTKEHFLRGRQTTNAQGRVHFVSIYPGWYPGRAPHLHVEVKRDGRSLLVTQIAFPEAISNAVYRTAAYNGSFDTPNFRDGEFEDSLSRNMASLSGNIKDGYTLEKIIKVAG